MTPAQALAFAINRCANDITPLELSDLQFAYRKLEEQQSILKIVANKVDSPYCDPVWTEFEYNQIQNSVK